MKPDPETNPMIPLLPIRSLAHLITFPPPHGCGPIAGPDDWESDCKVAAEAKTYWQLACVVFVFSCLTLWQGPNPQASFFLFFNLQTRGTSMTQLTKFLTNAFPPFRSKSLPRSRRVSVSVWPERERIMLIVIG